MDWNSMNRRSGCRSTFIAAVVLLSCSLVCTSDAAITPGLQSSSVAKAILKYFGKEGASEASEYLAQKGGRELAERVGQAALREGGEEATEQVTRLATKYGPDALSALDNAPAIAPVLRALDELPESQVRSALARLSAGSAGRELAETVNRYGAIALRSELLHPGVGGMLVRTLGKEGAELSTKLSSDQAVALARHAEDLARLPAVQRSGVLSILRNDADRFARFMGRFAEANPGKVLFSAATTTVILAEPERILGGDEIVFDADGNPILMSKPGIAGRTMAVGGDAIAHVSVNYIRPLFYALMAFVGVFATLWAIIKLYRPNHREKQMTQAMVDQALLDQAANDSSNTIEASAVKKN